jgi:hypothetical protein
MFKPVIIRINALIYCISKNLKFKKWLPRQEKIFPSSLQPAPHPHLMLSCFMFASFGWFLRSRQNPRLVSSASSSLCHYQNQCLDLLHFQEFEIQNIASQGKKRFSSHHMFRAFEVKTNMRLVTSASPSSPSIPQFSKFQN